MANPVNVTLLSDKSTRCPYYINRMGILVLGIVSPNTAPYTFNYAEDVFCHMFDYFKYGIDLMALLDFGRDLINREDDVVIHDINTMKDLDILLNFLFDTRIEKNITVRYVNINNMSSTFATFSANTTIRELITGINSAVDNWEKYNIVFTEGLWIVIYGLTGGQWGDPL